jgi:uncharacterized protein (TIGR03000 family)
MVSKHFLNAKPYGHSVSKHFLTTSLCIVFFLGTRANLVAGGRGGAYSGGGFSGGSAYGSGLSSTSGLGASGGRPLGSGGFYGGSLFYGDYITGGGYPGYFAPYTYPSRSFSYADPYYSTRGFANQATPSMNLMSNQLALLATPAFIQVALPHPQAKVVIDGNLTTSTGSKRLYTTPQLKSGATYDYLFHVTWLHDGRQVTQERTVTVIPGQTTEVIFTSPADSIVK